MRFEYLEDKVVRLISLNDGHELLQLRKLRHRSLYIFEISFTGMSEQEWMHVYREMDPRDVPMQFELSDGRRYHYAGADVGYDSIKKVLKVRWMREFPEPPTRWQQWIQKIRGLPPLVRPSPDRAPFGRKFPTNRHKILRDYSRGDKETKVNVIEDACWNLSARDAEWLVPILLDAARSLDSELLHAGCWGLGEIARVAGYSNTEIVIALKLASSNASPGIRATAARALDAVSRFTGVFIGDDAGP